MTGDAKSPLRICILISGFYPAVGGGEQHARLLGREWVRQGHQVVVITRHSHPETPSREHLDGMEIRRVRAALGSRWGKYTMIPAVLFELRRLQEDLDVVYVCAFRVLGWPAVRFSRRSGIPCVLRAEAHGEWSGAFIWSRATGMRRRILRAIFDPLIQLRNRVLLQTEAFVAISEGVEQELKDGGVPVSSILRIPNGLDLERFQPAGADEQARLRTTLKIPQAKMVWCYSGKLIRGKGLEELLDVWTGLSEPERPLLFLVGSGAGQSLSCESELRKTIQQHRLQDQVHITGYVEDVAVYLKAADAFVFPSEKETFGLAPLEAMACGLPVLATRSGGVEEFMVDGRNAALVDVGDSSALTQIIREWSGPEGPPTDLGAAGRRTVAERFSIQAVASEHLDKLPRRPS